MSETAPDKKLKAAMARLDASAGHLRCYGWHYGGNIAADIALVLAVLNERSASASSVGAVAGTTD